MHTTFYDLLTLLGALGLFLYGMKVMSDALAELGGDRMRGFLASATANRLYAVLTGFAMTALIQSSSATTLMVVSFANAALLTLNESIAVIMGANIGTTVTAWLVSILGFKISLGQIAIPLVGVGFLMSLSKKSKNTRHWGSFITGFALLFIGLEFLKEVMPDISAQPQMLAFLGDYTEHKFLSIALFLAAGSLVTMIIQSSSATMAITIIMCYQGWIPFELAAAMVLGENIGTTVTANLAAIVANSEAKRVARAHLIFNMFGVLWVLLLFNPMLHTVDLVAQQLQGTSAFSDASAIPVALSLFHSLFNVINTALLIGFVPLIARIVTTMVPAVEEKKPTIEQPHFLDETSLKYPQTGIKALLDESLRLFESTVYEVITHGLEVHRKELESDQDIARILENIHDIELDVDTIYYQKFKTIYNQVVEYATHLQSQFDLDEEKIVAISSILRADRLMVVMVKDVKPLHINMNRYLHSDNPHIRNEYNHIRRMILSMLRLVRKARADQQEEEAFLKTAQGLKEQVDSHDVLLNGTIDRLVREHLITNDMATSLMNDSVIAIHITRDLIDVAELLYLQRDIFNVAPTEQPEASVTETLPDETADEPPGPEDPAKKEP